MTITEQFLDEVIKRIDAVSASGRSLLQQLMLNAPAGFNYEKLFEYVKEHYLPIVEACDDNAAAVGASAYDAYREIQTGEMLGAMPYSTYSEEHTTNAIKDIVGKACARQDMAWMIDYLGRRLDSEIMHSYSNTGMENGIADPKQPRFARVPIGNNPCAFCRALAGHGFFYKTRQTAGDLGTGFNSFHNFCRCQVVPEFSEAANILKVSGYDPKVYVQEWRETRQQFGKNRNVKITATPKQSTAMPKIEKPLLTEKPKDAELPAKMFGGEWNQKEDMDRFLKAMYGKDEYVGTCAEFYTSKDGRRVPTRGLFQRTAGQVENVLDNTNNVSAAIGRYKVQDGAYVRINPLDGKGISDLSVTDFRYALIECDTLPLEQQYGYIKALNLPTKTIVSSGKKSIHAAVMIDAENIDQYRERVALLHAECKAAGFDVDASTKNPSRYMRLPGVRRGDGRQVLISTGEGADSWDDWREWCETVRQ